MVLALPDKQWLCLTSSACLTICRRGYSRRASTCLRHSCAGCSVGPSNTALFSQVHYADSKRHAVAKTTDVLWSGRERYRLVHLPLILLAVSSVIWSAAGFGPRTNPLPHLRCWPAAAGEASWTSSTLLCRRHSDLWILRPVGC